MSLSVHAAYAVLEALNLECRGAVVELFDELHADADAFDQLRARWRAGRELGHECRYDDALLLSWLVAKSGPEMVASCEAFEASVIRCAGGELPTPLVMPKWALAEPVAGALQRRVPCLPLVRGDDEDVLRAYEGLVEHVSYLAALGAEQRGRELLNTAIPWRIVALADKLEPERSYNDSIAARLARLKSKMTGGGHASASDKQWWRALDDGVCARRHALSHLCETMAGGQGVNDKWTFRRCVEECWSVETALEATAGIALAVMAQIAWSLSQAAPPVSALDSVLTASAWLDDYVEGDRRDGKVEPLKTLARDPKVSASARGTGRARC
jgi:hypothetical protein